ncbi:Cytochrome c oxidase polypeptide 5, mitochondrial [Botrytis cinerea]
MLRTSIVRAATGSVVRNQVRCASTHAISNPTLADIEKSLLHCLWRPRTTSSNPPGEGWKVFGYTMGGVGVSLALFLTIRSFAKGTPSTMNKEWEEATNEYLRAQNSEPISGLSSEGYSGPGQVQSAPKKN